MGAHPQVLHHVLDMLLKARDTDVFKHRGLADKKTPAKSTERGLKVHTGKANSFTGVLDDCGQKHNPAVPYFPGNELNEHARSSNV